MGLLLTAAPSGAERPTDPRSGCGNDLRPSSDGCPSQAGEASDGHDGDDSPSGEGCNALGGARAGPHADSEISCCAGNESPGGGDSWSCFGCWLLQQCRAFATSGRWTAAQDLSGFRSFLGVSHMAQLHITAEPACVGMSVVVIF